jgi:FAD/FMN-containing dehydrogenase
VQCNPATLALHRAVKQAFDPKGLMNPGKKL